MITVLRRGLHPGLAHPADRLLRAEDLWHQARMLIAEVAQQSQMYQQQLTLQQGDTLREVGRQLIAATDLAALMDTLARALPGLSIPSCYIALYEDAAAPAEGSRLVLAYGEDGQRELQTAIGVSARSNCCPQASGRRTGSTP